MVTTVEDVYALQSVSITWTYHVTFLVNSACHIWGTKLGNTDDLSKNNLSDHRLGTERIRITHDGNDDTIMHDVTYDGYPKKVQRIVSLVIAGKYVDKDFGTGVLKISPGMITMIYLFAKKLGLPILTVMNKDGILNEVAGLYKWVTNCTQEIIAELEETGLAAKKEANTSRVPRSQRGVE
ncbi:valine--tRNA ligase, chloroplastic/mitochondrial 2 isoform X1, partial [Tanacetum coccineum]